MCGYWNYLTALSATMIGLDLELLRRHLIFLAATLAIIACYLIWRRPEFGLPPLLAKYGGLVLWGAMVFFAIARLLQGARLSRIAGGHSFPPSSNSAS